MQVSVTGRHGVFGDSIREYAETRIRETLSDFPRIESAHIILNTEKHRQQAEVVVQGKDHLRIDGHAEAEHIRQAVDEAIDKVERQVRKLREKVVHHKGNEKLGEFDLGVQSSVNPGS